MESLTAWEKLNLIHRADRLNAFDYISRIFESYYEMHGDRLYGDDRAITGGIAIFKNVPVTVVATVRGKTLDENKEFNFSMAHPEGYRKALRLAKQAEKFKRPLICLIDTPGAYCGVEAEKRGQGEAIAKNILEFMNLKTPIISIITGEGGSGGALGLGVCDELAMLENSLYSVISPRGAANILWRDSKKEEEAANVMKITAQDLLEFGVAEKIISEPDIDDKNYEKIVCENVSNYLVDALKKICEKDIANLLNDRYNKFRKIGIFNE